MRILVLTIFFLSLAACTDIEETHGASLRPANVSSLTPNSNKNDVFDALGSPSTKSTYGEETWYYINNKTERRIFGEDEMLEQTALAISFDPLGIVSNVELYDLEDGKAFDFSDRVTPTAGHELTILEQLLGNLGKFNPGDK